MKKLVLIAAVVLSAVQLNAQENENDQKIEFGTKVGYINITAKADVQGVSVSISESGFFGGVFGEFLLGSNFSIQPEIIYAIVEDVGFLYVPVLAKYYVAKNFSLHAGPQINYVLEDLPEENQFGLDIVFGAGYDITEEFFIDARYAFEVTNRVSEMQYEDVSGRYNTLMVGIGYKF